MSPSFSNTKSTLQDVCRLAGVSTATVSRVINGSRLVVEDTRERVHKAMRELNYYPSYAARTLARQRTDQLGVVFPDVDFGFYVEVLKGLDQKAAQRGFQVLTAFAHKAREDEEKQLIERFLFGRRTDGMVLLNVHPDPISVECLKGTGLPLAVIGSPVHAPAVTNITQDNAGGAAVAMTHLLQLGYRHVWILSGPMDSYDSNERLKGCRQAYRAAGLQFDADVFCGQFTREGGEQVVAARLAEGRPLPDAIFALNDAMALSTIKVLQRNRFQVPGDVAVVGYDDSETAEFAGLTSVHAPMIEMGRAAAEVVINAITGRIEYVGDQQLPTHLVVRSSCGAGVQFDGYPAGVRVPSSLSAPDLGRGMKVES